MVLVDRHNQSVMICSYYELIWSLYSMSYVLFHFIIVCSCLFFLFIFSGLEVEAFWGFILNPFWQDSWQNFHTPRHIRRADTSDLFLLHFLGVHCFIFICLSDSLGFSRSLHLRPFFLFIIFTSHVYITAFTLYMFALNPRNGVSYPSLLLLRSSVFLYSVYLMSEIHLYKKNILDRQK